MTSISPAQATMQAGPSMDRQIPQSPPKLSGTVPGVLDHTQRDRLCRGGSILSFASFDPHTASPHIKSPALDDRSLNEKLYRPKRVVIEITPSGVSTWRFVPSARREEGVPDEGTWPRVVNVCGTYYECSQEQWDIYKLDPLYDCLVRAPPNVPSITPVTEYPQTVPPPPFGKRVPSPTGEAYAPFSQAKKRRVEVQTESEDEKSEVEDMIIDDEVSRPKLARTNGRMKKYVEKLVTDKKERLERMARRIERLATQGNGETEFTFTAPTERSTNVPVPPAIGKRKGTTLTSLFDSLRTNGDHDTETTRLTDEEPLRNRVNYVTTTNAKRTRTVSPSTAKEDLAARRQVREERKAKYWKQEHEARRLAREAELLKELYRNNSDVEMQYASEATAKMESASGEEEITENGAVSSDEDVDDEEAARQAAIALSRRKLAELEADRPLWEQAAAKRREQERLEAEAMRQRAEAKKRAEEAEKVKERREREERRRREEEAQRKAREEAAQRTAEQERRRQAMKRERDSWRHGHWTVERAKERYSKLSERFDKTKYSPDELPLSADEIPWPMLSRDFDLEDVTWQAVAEFFNAVQPTMTTMEFKKFIIKSHVRFHTDRWASRRLLESVKDEVERGVIEIANKMVIQQLTPIWEGVCGKKADHPHY
ncbi:putative zinc finger, C3HC4 type (RING finger) [Lyophyllum shimeji]|uniref:Zinc finger, C3HC4 type (RING finger) n=1 Tax=Lyophyllum shimeji TaxID=47721 RepID=A0A9P3UL62_LYOSH|nr:putative zinc finger, C3HC4 type (RING finger) [Lyophyllum shimeji]